MRRIGNTTYRELTARQREEYKKFLSYGDDLPRLLRDRAGKPPAPAREYGVALKFVGAHRWQDPTDTFGSLRDAEKLHESIVTRVSPAVVVAAKVVSRTKAGAWEFEDGEAGLPNVT
jgi:hypothetical protein